MGAETWAQETFDDVMASRYGPTAALAHKLRRALGDTPPSAVVVVSDELPTGEMLAQHQGRIVAVVSSPTDIVLVQVTELAST